MSYMPMGQTYSLVFNSTLDGFQKLLSRTRERESCKDDSVSGFVKRLENYSAQELLEKKNPKKNITNPAILALPMLSFTKG